MTGEVAVALMLEELGLKKCKTESPLQSWNCFMASNTVKSLWHHPCYLQKHGMPI